MKISVVLCAYNPDISYLTRVIDSLKKQTLDQNQWEFILIDNKSTPALADPIYVEWHSFGRIIRENKPGLIHARVRGAMEAKHEIIVSVDDDTPLFADYLEHVVRIYSAYPDMGVIGGRTIPEFAVTPPDWILEFHTCLAIRDLGDEVIIENVRNTPDSKAYPRAAPLLIAPKRSCLLEYIEHYKQNELSQSLGRKGNDLRSGEDNDINFFIFRKGYSLGYFPELKFIHLIPEKRLRRKYLADLSEASGKSWIELQQAYGINSWPKIPKWTLKLRKLRSYIRHRAWASDPNYIHWRESCGKFDALANL